VGLLCIATALALCAADILAPKPGYVAYLASHDGPSDVWSNTYDFQLERLVALEKATFYFAILGIILIWCPRSFPFGRWRSRREPPK
jgi:hypothetical protein